MKMKLTGSEEMEVRPEAMLLRRRIIFIVIIQIGSRPLNHQERDETLICPKRTQTHQEKEKKKARNWKKKAKKRRENFEQWAGAENKNGIPAEERETEISLSSSC